MPELSFDVMTLIDNGSPFIMRYFDGKKLFVRVFEPVPDTKKVCFKQTKIDYDASYLERNPHINYLLVNIGKLKLIESKIVFDTADIVATYDSAVRLEKSGYKLAK